MNAARPTQEVMGGRAFVTEKGVTDLSSRAHAHFLPRQFITLAFLSDRLPASLIGERIAQSLVAEIDERVLLLRIELQEGNLPATRGTEPDVFLNGEFHLPSEIRKTDGGFYALTLGVESRPSSPASFESLMTQLAAQFRHVLIEMCDCDRAAIWLSEFLVRTDLAFLFLPPTEEAVSRLERVNSAAKAQCLNGGVHIKPIVCLAKGEDINGFDALAQRVATPAHMFVRGYPADPRLDRNASSLLLPDSFRADLRRLAREIGGRLVGLALSSGAAKGFAHIGVIQVLEENGIEVDVVAGSSMGAYIGALWAYGLNGQDLERLARELEGRWALWSLIDPVFPPRQGFLRGYAIRRRLMRSIGNSRFADMIKPLRVVAGDLATLDRVVFTSGEVATAVHASMAVPGVCVPLMIDGVAYIDGGVVDPLPADVLREMGVSQVIAVDVIPTPDRMRTAVAAETELARQKPRRRWFRKGLHMNEQLNYFARGNLFEILVRSVHGAQMRLAEASCRLADLVLRPEVCDDRWMDCANPGRFIALGREAAEKHLAEIKRLVARKETADENELVTTSVARAA
jgi:NTE family protein